MQMFRLIHMAHVVTTVLERVNATKHTALQFSIYCLSISGIQKKTIQLHEILQESNTSLAFKKNND